MNEQKIRCKKCGSTLIYFRIKDKVRVCRHCGYQEEIKDEK